VRERRENKTKRPERSRPTCLGLARYAQTAGTRQNGRNDVIRAKSKPDGSGGRRESARTTVGGRGHRKRRCVWEKIVPCEHVLLDVSRFSRFSRRANQLLVKRTRTARRPAAAKRSFKRTRAVRVSLINCIRIYIYMYITSHDILLSTRLSSQLSAAPARAHTYYIFCRPVEKVDAFCYYVVVFFFFCCSPVDVRSILYTREKNQQQQQRRRFETPVVNVRRGSQTRLVSTSTIINAGAISYVRPVPDSETWRPWARL